MTAIAERAVETMPLRAAQEMLAALKRVSKAAKFDLFFGPTPTTK